MHLGDFQKRCSQALPPPSGGRRGGGQWRWPWDTGAQRMPRFPPSNLPPLGGGQEQRLWHQEHQVGCSFAEIALGHGHLCLASRAANTMKNVRQVRCKQVEVILRLTEMITSLAHGPASLGVLVVHTWPQPDPDTGEEVGRIISARKATSHERRAYEEGAF